MTMLSRLTRWSAKLGSPLVQRTWWVPLAVVGLVASMFVPTIGRAQAPGVSEGVVCNTSTSASFVLTAQTGYISTPDGNSLFMWGYGLGNGSFQYVGPIICVNEGDSVTVTLKNALGVPTSLNFPGLTRVKANGATPSYDPATASLTTAALPGGTVTYTFVADHPGTFLYESGTNPQVQVLMGMVGALIVRPTHVSAATCPAVPQTVPVAFVYDDCSTAYSPNHEFMHLLTEIDPHMHHAIELSTCVNVVTTPACTPAANPTYDMTQYKPRYWMINGRSFPDDLTPNFSTSVPTQPYGALVHISPSCPAPDSFQGSSTIQCKDSSPTSPDYNPLQALVRFLNGGPVSYPFHPHGDHDSQIGLDGRVLINPHGPGGKPVITSVDRFDVVVPPGETIDATFGWVDAQQWDPSSNPIGVAQPQAQNLINGPFWSGSAYLGQKLPLLNGTTQWNQCGEYYHFAHSHALFQVTNYGSPGGGMLTFIRVDPPPSLQKRYGTSCDGGMGYN
jgi:hypothetical protein